MSVRNLRRYFRTNNRLSFRYRGGPREYVAVNRVASNGRLIARDVRANWDGENRVRTFDPSLITEIRLHRGELV